MDTVASNRSFPPGYSPSGKKKMHWSVYCMKRDTRQLADNFEYFVTMHGCMNVIWHIWQRL